MTESDEVLERIHPSPSRRVMAVGCLGMLGFLLLAVAATHPPADIVGLLFLIAVGSGALYLSWRLWQATGVALELTRHELREAGGEVLARLEDVARVDRGFFAFKPAAGFRLTLREKAPSHYAPGLWWRWRRMVMVGGVTSRGQARATADMISILMAKHRGDI